MVTMQLENTFDKLPSKARQQILYYCSKWDLKSLSSCSKTWNTICQPHLFTAVHLSWESLQVPHNDEINDLLPSLKHTTSLKLTVDDDDLSMFYNDDDSSVYHPPKSLTWESVGPTLKTMFSRCDYTRLRSLQLNGFFQVPGVYLVCTYLPDIRFLTITDLHTLPCMGWRLLFSLPRMEKLSLLRCTCPKEALNSLADSAHLKDISFTKIASLDDEDLGKLSKLPELTRVSLAECPKVSEHGIEILCTTAANLQEVSLVEMSFDNETLNRITQCPTNLKTLTFQHCNASNHDGHSFEFGKLTSLRELRLFGINDKSPATVDSICSLKSLRNLQLGAFQNITDGSVKVIANSLTSLTELSLTKCKLITLNGLQSLVELSSLTKLDVSRCDLNDEALGFLGKMTSLEMLDLSGTSNISDDGLSRLTPLKLLRELNISNCRKITDEGLRHVCSMSHLQILDISMFEHGTQSCIANSGLIYLVKLEQLRILTMSGSDDIKENGFIVLAQVKSLQELHCHGIEDHFSDHHMEDFCRMTGMREKAQIRSPISGPVSLTKNRKFWPRNGNCGLSWNCYCMTTNLLELPFEVREKICSYLTKHQIKTFALCSKLCRESVRHILWNSVEIHWKSLEESLDIRTLESFSYVKTLCFILDDDDHFYRHDDLGEYRCTGEIVEWEDVASTFRFILSFCDPEKLSKVVFNGFMLDEGIDLLRQLHRNLTHLSLTNCYLISDIGWKIIGTFPNLSNLTVKGCNLYSRRLKEVVAAPCVNEVEIRCVPSLNDVGMEVLSHVSALKKLVVTRNSEITELGFIELIRLEKLEEAHFYDVSLGDHALASICLCSLDLKKLYVSFCKVTDLGLMYLGNLKSLSHLTLTGFSEPMSTALEYIVGLSTLRQLNISGCTNVTNDTVTLISKSMAHLKDLNISRCMWVTDAGVLALTTLKNLRKLNISECTLLTDLALFHLKKLTTLNLLDISGCDDFTGEGLQCLSTLDSLHDLFLRNCKGITDDVISHLCPMQRLDFIDLTEVNQTFLTDVGLVYMSKIFSLKVVAFTWTEKVSSDGFLLLCALPFLEEVIVDIDDIPDDPFEEFCALSGMKEKAQYISVDINPVILTKNSRYWPRNGKCGLRWNCACAGGIVWRGTSDMPDEVVEEMNQFR